MEEIESIETVVETPVAVEVPAVVNDAVTDILPVEPSKVGIWPVIGVFGAGALIGAALYTGGKWLFKKVKSKKKFTVIGGKDEPTDEEATEEVKDQEESK